MYGWIAPPNLPLPWNAGGKQPLAVQRDKHGTPGPPDNKGKQFLRVRAGSVQQDNLRRKAIIASLERPGGDQRARKALTQPNPPQPGGTSASGQPTRERASVHLGIPDPHEAHHLIFTAERMTNAISPRVVTVSRICAPLYDRPVRESCRNDSRIGGRTVERHR